MDDPFLKLHLDPDTRAVTDAAIALLHDAHLVHPSPDPRQLQANALKEIILASSALPLRVRWLVLLRRPLRTWRVRRALRPLRATIRTRLPLPDETKPWIEDHEAFRILLHGL